MGSEIPIILDSVVSHFRFTPENTCMESLSPAEVDALAVKQDGAMLDILNRCVLAVLNSGEETDDVKAMLAKYRNFSFDIVKTAGGIELEMKNVPLQAFVTYEQKYGKKSVQVPKIIEGIRQNVFAVIRDLVFINSEIERTGQFDIATPEGITDAVFLILRNAGIFQKTGRHKVVVCWGGHSIRAEEYAYTEEVGYQCGIRFMDIITGCGPGAMKGPMEGAAIAHAKQRVKDGRYIGISEPGIIASEAPNAIVDPLVIMPDIEKRLEAFVRLGHGIIIFPGGAGTAEELMYILGILTHPKNSKLPFPLILTGPKSTEAFFEKLDGFIRATLGDDAAQKYQIIIDNPIAVAQQLNKGMLEVKTSREALRNSYYFNRSLHIPPVLQESFTPSHEAVSALCVRPDSEPHLFAANLRRFFSAVVWGNVKPDGVRAIEAHGPLEVSGDPGVLSRVDDLLKDFISQGRMRLVGDYTPVYKVK